MAPRIDDVIQRTRRYWYEDGFAELASGGLFALAGIGLAAAYRAFVGWTAGSPDLAARCLVALAVIGAAQALAVIGGRFLRGGVEAAKQHVTYPRTGYVAYRQPQPKKRSLPEQIGAFALMLVISLVGGAVMGNVLATLGSSGALPAWLISMPMSLAAVIAIVLVVLARQMALARFYGLAGASLLAGLAAAMGDLAFEGGMLYLTFMGLILLVSGCMTLWRYTRRYVPLDLDAEDDHGE